MHTCPLCHKMFSRQYNLTRHTETIHAEEGSTMDNNEHEMYNEGCHKKRFTEDTMINAGALERTDSESIDSEHNDSDGDDTSSQSEGDTEYSSDLEDNAAFQDWLDDAKETTNDAWTEKYEKYIQEGLSKGDAREKADIKTMWVVKRCFFDTYKDFLFSYFHLKDDITHEEVVDEVQGKIDKGMGLDKALRRVLPKHHFKFNALFHQTDDLDENGEEDAD